MVNREIFKNENKETFKYVPLFIMGKDSFFLTIAKVPQLFKGRKTRTLA